MSLIPFFAPEHEYLETSAGVSRPQDPYLSLEHDPSSQWQVVRARLYVQLIRILVSRLNSTRQRDFHLQAMESLLHSANIY